MITVEPSEIKLTDQINALQTEITSRKTDIANLKQALDTLLAGKPRPANPESDNAFEMLKQLVGNVPESLEQQHIYQAKLGEAQRTLELAIAACKQKESELEELQQKQHENLADKLFEEIKVKAERFNCCVSEVIELLGQIQETSRQIYTLRGNNPLSGVYFEKRELPWCVVSERSILIKRKFDIR